MPIDTLPWLQGSSVKCLCMFIGQFCIGHLTTICYLKPHPCSKRPDASTTTQNYNLRPCSHIFIIPEKDERNYILGARGVHPPCDHNAFSPFFRFSPPYFLKIFGP